MKPQTAEATRRPFPRAWMVLIVFDICAFAAVVAQEDSGDVPQPETRVVQLEGPTDVAADDVRFEAIDVIVDSGTRSLAAYQLEVASQTEGVEIVGIEGGEHPAFSEPPFYDPKAMSGNRVILAAFDTGKDLPKGRTRVARIHVQLQGPGVKEYRTQLDVSATQDGVEIPAKLEIKRVKA